MGPITGGITLPVLIDNNCTAALGLIGVTTIIFVCSQLGTTLMMSLSFLFAPNQSSNLASVGVTTIIFVCSQSDLASEQPLLLLLFALNPAKAVSSQLGLVWVQW